MYSQMLMGKEIAGKPIYLNFKCNQMLKKKKTDIAIKLKGRKGDEDVANSSKLYIYIFLGNYWVVYF